MDLLCTIALFLFGLCSPGQTPATIRPDTPLVYTRVSPSTGLLGRQITAAPPLPRDLALPFDALQPWGDPRRLAYCGPDGIRSSLDGGESWRTVPTDGVATLADATDWPLAPRFGSAPSCQSVTLDPGAADTFYAVFAAVRRPQDAPPPWFAAGYVTRDAGRTWEAVTAPADAPDAQFGRFTSEAGPVQALFSLPASQPENARRRPATATVTPPLVLQAADNGQRWEVVPFGCPAEGICVRWGAPPTGIGSCGMHGYPQPLLVSADAGQSWRAPENAPAVNACRPNTLLTISDRELLLLAPGGDEIVPHAAPVRSSSDGGQAFMGLPLPPPATAAALFEAYALPDTRLLARVSGAHDGPGWRWLLLDGRSADGGRRRRLAPDRWCIVAEEVALPQTGTPLTVAGPRIWWLGEDGQPASRAVTDLRCE